AACETGWIMPGWIEAGGWGLLAGSALLVGSAVGDLVRLPPRVVASVMAFGAGVLLSAVAFDLISEAYEQGGLTPTVFGAVAGAIVYTGCNIMLAWQGARHRKRSGGGSNPRRVSRRACGTALALGALLDGIPESVVIGASLVGGGVVSAVTVAAVFVSNVPERAVHGRVLAVGLRSVIRP
ncbi:ZIP family metal transporter, partial [Parafrankia elaeagni]|uniref:ZIP family metal transporter n=1 Tax=Parafrankia elaeagni TaxID=222534 RepID=UPI003899535E